ncbi:MAG: hypothetical protein HRT88_15180 [Lentisphaeraceae bacterium]|nr:hypothetical protein [Lentisphaeraceae bacterium]
MSEAPLNELRKLSTIQADTPISAGDKDDFEREGFARAISDQLVIGAHSPSMVFGLEGRWGEGKTSLINMISDELEKKQNFDPVILHFNPWIIQGVDTLMKEFIKFFIDGLKEKWTAFDTGDKLTKVSKLLDNMVNFGNLLTPLSLLPQAAPFVLATKGFLGGMKKSADAAKKLSELDSMSSITLKNKIEEGLRELGQPVVVFIDDIDRLPPEQVRIIFQMVKAVCNFDGIAYFLSYDLGPVSKALSFDGVDDGEQYIEKIVQQVYHLPRASFYHRHKFLVSNLHQLFNRLEIELYDYEKELMNGTYINAALIIENPRDIIRLINKLSWCVGPSRGEVNVMDIVLFLALEAKYSKVTKEIRLHPYLYSSDAFDEAQDFIEYVSNQSSNNNEQSQPGDQTLEKLLVLEGQNENSFLRSVLVYLFPQGKGNDKAFLNSLQKGKRLSLARNLNKFLHAGIPSFILSDKAFDAFMTDSSLRQAILQDEMAQGKIVEFIQQLTLRIDVVDDSWDLDSLECDLNLLLANGCDDYEGLGHSLHIFLKGLEKL